jgi:hypothetical protein
MGWVKKLGNLTEFGLPQVLYNLCPGRSIFSVAPPLMKPSDPLADPLKSEDLDRIQILIYLVPVLGFFPALWTLYRQDGGRSRQNASRLAVTLAMGWLVGYTLLGAGSAATDSLPLLITSSLLTSGYFLTNIWLMVRLWQGQAIRLPGISRLSDRIP